MPSRRKVLGIFFKLFSILILTSCATALFFAYHFYHQIEDELPDIHQLKNVKYQIPLSIYSTDNKLIARFGEKKRIPITIEDIPEMQIKAFLAAEDDSFFSHPGVDVKGLIRAAVELIRTGKKKQGGSTITMQVARNFLLSREKTYIRKIKEIILALKIDNQFSKNEVLELYLNKIYLGHRSYGIAAAAQTYYGKPLDQLNLAQMAMLAGLPKAPSNFNPVTNPERALIRRDYILNRMFELGYIDNTTFKQALNSTVSASLNSSETETSAPFIAEMVRQQLFEKYGEDLYTSGLKVYTTIDENLQKASDHALRKTLHAYDQRHGYRSLPHTNLESSQFKSRQIGDTQLAKVTQISNNSVHAVLADQQPILIEWQNIEWARQFKSRNSRGAKLKSADDLIAINELIRVRTLDDGSWSLAQVPEIEGAFIALDPHDGKILALSGGFDFFHNKYNRVIQSKRQPGSGFKPIIYATALENGYTAASIINDAPIIVSGNALESDWRPENYSRKFYGPTSLRTALRKSRNLISIRLMKKLGIEKVRRSAYRFGFASEQLPKNLSLSLGSGQATPLEMARVYATFANKGFVIEPHFIKQIKNYNDEIIFSHTPKTSCLHCDEFTFNSEENLAPRILSPGVAFIMDSLLRDVVKRGTATKAKVIQRSDLAGKTGTTNDQRDAWFNGYATNIVATAWVGLDDSSPLGRGETGGKAALPMWIDFMKKALSNLPEAEMQLPENIAKAYIDPETGLLARTGSAGIWEYFRKEYLPYSYSQNEAEDTLENTTEETAELF